MRLLRRMAIQPLPGEQLCRIPGMLVASGTLSFERRLPVLILLEEDYETQSLGWTLVQVSEFVQSQKG